MKNVTIRSKMYVRRATAKLAAGTLARIALAAVQCLALSGAPPARAQAPTSESALKVAFIFNFLKFTQWPPTAFGSEKDPIIVCVVGDSDLDGPLDALRNRIVQNRTITLRRTSGEAGSAPCHVTYYGSEANSAVSNAQPSGGNVTIGDSPRFAENGGMINFYRADGRLRFEINTQAARVGLIYFSADLLNLAKIVQPEGG